MGWDRSRRGQCSTAGEKRGWRGVPGVWPGGGRVRNPTEAVGGL